MLTLEIIYTDADLIECAVRARSGSFAAATAIYFTSDSLVQFATRIAGFPVRLGDHREFEAESLGNTFRLRLDALEAAGRCTAAVEITDSGDAQQSATLRFPVYAGEIDSFQEAVRGLSESQDGDATLGARATSAI